MTDDQAGRPFGMAGTAVVLHEPGRAGHDERRHAETPPLTD